MDRELFELKTKVVSVISDKIYYGLINFAEKIYNADYDVVILMARKASNLYAALLPLLKEEYLGSIAEEHERRGDNTAMVISDRAIERVLSDINKNGLKTKFKRILITDDIIIHGTTISQIREKLQRAYAEAGISENEYQIDIMAYAENMDGIALNGEDICNADTIVKCSRSSWKKISNRIIDVLRIMGRPYTSYVPNAEFKFDSPQGESIKTFIQSGKMKEISDRNMHRRDVKVYIVTHKSKEKYAICETYRIYEYQYLKKYVFVPMVTINPVNEAMLKRYIAVLIDYLTAKGKSEIGMAAQDFETEYPYRLAIYILSALSGWSFFEKAIGQKADGCKYDEREEILNFSCAFLRVFSDLEDETMIVKTFQKINDIYVDLQDEMNCLEDQAFGLDVQQLKEKVDEIVDYAGEKADAENVKFSDDIIAKVLETNNRLDEDKFIMWKKEGQKKSRKRMKGMPVVNIYKELEQVNSSIEQISKAIVHAIDTGKGSIVPFTVECLGQKIFVSMLRAGEQNYRYYVDNYFPIMYGFYLIETMSTEQKTVKEQKVCLWDQYYENREMPFFGEMDKEYLINSVLMDQEFGDVIIEEALRENDPETLEINRIINSQAAGYKSDRRQQKNNL